MTEQDTQNPVMTEEMFDFRTGVYFEHLEEASFLYEQRLSLLDDPEITWKDVAEFEERFEAHIDALVVGEDLALNVCHTQAMDGDFGELHAAVRVFCRQNRADFVAEAWRDIDSQDTDSIQAIGDALKDECPDPWRERLAPIFSSMDPTLISVGALLFGYRRYRAENLLLHALNRLQDTVLPVLIWALGRIGSAATRSALFPLLEHSDPMVRKAAAESLLRFGETRVVAHGLSLASLENWPLIAVGLGGNHQAAKVLIDRIARGAADKDSLIALGILGHLSAVSVLYSLLENKDLGRAAATGLFLITGAELYEEVFIPEEIDEEELFEEELEAYRKDGKTPTGADGQPYGETVRRLSQNPLDWETWLRENKSRFDPNHRYRLGRPYSPACLFQTLLSEASPYRARQLAIEELKIRYNADFPIEVDMPVVMQRQILPRIAQWVQTNEPRFQPGAWYFAGRPMPG